MQKCQKRLVDTEALLTRAMKRLNENQRLIQEQEKLIKKGKQANLGGYRKFERETAGSCRDCKKA